MIFSGVAIRPGKPTVFARQGDRLVFGLPGNPISTFVSFELFVRPALGRICGFASAGLFRVSGRLLLGVKHKSERTSFIPARLSWLPDGWAINPLRWKGSSDIIGFSQSQWLACPAAGQEGDRRRRAGRGLAPARLLATSDALAGIIHGELRSNGPGSVTFGLITT